MPKGYHHLTYDKRCQIYALLKRSISQSQIARDIGMDQSTISREISRNSGKRGYRYKQAQKKAVIRRVSSRVSPRKMDTALSLFVEYFLCNRQWSPEQISGYLRERRIHVSLELIYQHIWKNKQSGGNLYKHLRNRGKKYNKRANKAAGRGLIPNRIGIEDRPSIVDEKIRVGDFELDTIVGSKHHGAIVSIVDRKTKLTRLKLLPRATADKTSHAIIELLRDIKSHVQTLTSDNGKEFAHHAVVTKELEAGFYFANPYHAWERGLNENTNRLVRQYFPKKTDFATISDMQVKHVEYLLNNRPRKSLNFKTPNEVFYLLTKQNIDYALQA